MSGGRFQMSGSGLGAEGRLSVGYSASRMRDFSLGGRCMGCWSEQKYIYSLVEKTFFEKFPKSKKIFDGENFF